MKILAVMISVLAVLITSTWAAEVVTRYYIHSIGDGTLVVHSCLEPIRFAVRLDETTVQQLYRLQEPTGARGFSHVDAGGGLSFDTYSGYFVSNKFEPDAKQSFVVLTDQDQFDKVFGVAFVMNDKSHRLPKDAFKSLIVVAVIKRGNAFWEYNVEDVAVEQGAVQLRYTATSKTTPDTKFVCPLIVSVPRDEYKAVVFFEDGKKVRTVETANRLVK